MSIIDRLTPTVEFSDEHASKIHSRLESDFVQVYPSRNGGCVERGESVLNTLYQNRLMSHNDTTTLEVWSDNGKTQFFADASTDFNHILDSQYPGAEVSQQITSPNFDCGEFVSTASLTLNKLCAYPIRMYTDSEQDPLSNILTTMVGGVDEETTTGFQVVFKPVEYDWTEGGGSFSADVRSLASKEVSDPHQDPSGIFQDMTEQYNSPSFQVNIRLLTLGPSFEETQSHLSKLTNEFDHFYDVRTEQKFSVHSSRFNNGIRLQRFINAEFESESRISESLFGKQNILTSSELAGLVHLPDGSSEFPLQVIYSGDVV